jgi:hypothetical protein
MNARPAVGFLKCAILITTLCIIITNQTTAGSPMARVRWMEVPETSYGCIRIVALQAASIPCVLPGGSMKRLTAIA